MAMKTYRVIKFYKINPFKRLNVVGSLKVAMKDLTPLAYYLYNLLLFADKKDFSPSYLYLSKLLDITIAYTKILISELTEKGYVVIRKADKETHFIVYYDNLDSLITGEYHKKEEFDKLTYKRKYDRAFKRAVNSLEKKQKELEVRRKGELDG